MFSSSDTNKGKNKAVEAADKSSLFPDSFQARIADLQLTIQNLEVIKTNAGSSWTAEEESELDTYRQKLEYTQYEWQCSLTQTSALSQTRQQTPQSVPKRRTQHVTFSSTATYPDDLEDPLACFGPPPQAPSPTTARGDDPAFWNTLPSSPALTPVLTVEQKVQHLMNRQLSATSHEDYEAATAELNTLLSQL